MAKRDPRDAEVMRSQDRIGGHFVEVVLYKGEAYHVARLSDGELVEDTPVSDAIDALIGYLAAVRIHLGTARRVA